MAQVVADAYHKLPADEQKSCAIFGQNYGQVGAIDFFGAKMGLPNAISGHNNYYIYGPGKASGQVVIALGIERAVLDKEFRSVERVGTFHDEYLLPDQNDIPIYKCTQPVRSLSAWWPALKRYI